MTEPKISVIVAAYKVEDYLRKCVDSILSQTFKNLEVILVDDGSPDESGAICDEYALKDKRIRVIHKTNGGQSTARNKGLEIAQGDYIGFVDGDDWIEPAMYQTLYETMAQDNADIVQCGWYKVEPSGDKECPYLDDFKEIYSSDEGLDELIASQGGHLNTSVCCKLFKKDIAQQFRFSPVRAYEDDEYIFKTVSLANKIVCIHTPLYDYLNRENSTMTAKFNMNKVALVTIQKKITDYLEMRYPQRFHEMQKVLCSKQFYILNCLLTNPQLVGSADAAKKIFGDILLSYNSYMSNPNMGRNKLMLLLIKYTPQVIWSFILRAKFS